MSEKIFKKVLAINRNCDDIFFSFQTKRKISIQRGKKISKRRNERIMYQSFTLWTLGHHREYKATQLADYISALGKIYVRSYQGCRIHIKKKSVRTRYAKVRPFHRLLSYFCTALTIFYTLHAVSTLSAGQKQLSLKFTWYTVANNDTYTLRMHPKKGDACLLGSPYLDNRGASNLQAGAVLFRPKEKYSAVFPVLFMYSLSMWLLPLSGLKKKIMPLSWIMKIKPNKQR